MPFTENDRRSYLLGLRIMGDFGASIAVPVIIFVLIGKWLQTKYGGAPFGVVIGFVLSAALSARIIRRKTKWYAAEYKALESAKKK